MVKRKYNQYGFTFLEIVIAISILAIIITVSYESLSQILRGKKIIDDARDGKAIADSLLTRFSKELQLASAKVKLMPPRNNLKQVPVGQPSFLAQKINLEGSSSDQKFTQLSFVVTGDNRVLPDGSVQSGARQITYRTEPDPEDSNHQKLRLVREEVPILKSAKKAYQKGMMFPVATDLIQYELLFFDGDSLKWIETWGLPGKQTRKRLPDLIQIYFKVRSPLGAIQSYSTIIYIQDRGTL